MPPALPSFAARRDGRVVFSAGPTPLAITLTGLRSADAHDVTAYVSAAVRPVDRPADIALFAERFLAGRTDATDDDVRRHFCGAIQATAATFVAGQPAAAVLAGPAALAAALRDRFDAVAFACGLEPAGPLSVSLDSESVRVARARQSARDRQLADADHAARLAEALAAAGPAHRLPVADQASLLPTLRAAAAPSGLLVAAGPNLVVIDPDGGLRTIAMPAEIGPLRSIRRLDAATFAAGGTNGVALLNADFAVTGVLPGGGESGRGYNAVARDAAGRVIATHGEIGLTVWPAGAGPGRDIATPGAARGVHMIAAGVVVIAGHAVCRFDGETARPIGDERAPVVATTMLGNDLVVVREFGVIETYDGATLRPAAYARRTAPLTAAAALEAGGLRAVVVADDRGAIDAVTPDGRPVGRIATRPGGLRMLAVAGGAIAGVTPDRTAVIVWHPGDAADAPRTINVLARTGHHVTDMISRE